MSYKAIYCYAWDLAEAGIEPSIISAHIDLTKVEDFRRRIPSMQQDRAFGRPEANGTQK